MKKDRRRLARATAGILVLAVVLQCLPVIAQSYDPTAKLPKPTGLEKALTKFGRGISNITFSWAEVPLTFDRKLKEGKPLTYLLCVAPILGTARAVMRTTTGVFEVVSFPFSDKDVNYGAILEPDYIF